MGKTTGQRFASVWDALPPGLGMLQDDIETEAALFDAAQTLATQKGFALVRGVTGYRLSGVGRIVHGDIETIAKAVRNLPKSPAAASSGAGGRVDLGLPENALQAFFLALPIATVNWTDDDKNATCSRCTETESQSNE